MFNGNGDVIAIGYFWENQFIDSIVLGSPALSLALAHPGEVIGGADIYGNPALSGAFGHAGTVKTGARLPRPIGYTCVTVTYDRTCAN